MNSFLHATAHGQAALQLLESCLINIGTIPQEANVGFLYATDSLSNDLQSLLVRLKTQAPQVSWVGSIGMGLCTTAQEFYEEPALGLMIGSFPEDSFRIVPALTNGRLDPEVENWWNRQQFCFALLHGDPTNTKIAETLKRLASRSYTTFLNGGLSSATDNRTQQIADRVISDELSGILFNEQVEVLTDHTQGCSPIGPIHRLTKAQRNIAMRIDDRSAVDVLKEDIGEVMSRNLAQSAGYIFAALPIPGSDTGDYLVRNLLGIDEEHGLLAVGDYLDDQDQLMFCRRDGNSAREDMIRMLQRLKTRLGSKQIRGGVYISCLGRGRYQFGEQSEEMKLIEQELGNFPLVGFFANGEIYNGRLYGYTGVLSLFA